MKPGKHTTVQARILKYAQDVAWTFVPIPEAKERRVGFRLAAAKLCDARSTRRIKADSLPVRHRTQTGNVRPPLFFGVARMQKIYRFKGPSVKICIICG